VLQKCVVFVCVCLLLSSPVLLLRASFSDKVNMINNQILRKSVKLSIEALSVTLLGFILQVPLITDTNTSTIGNTTKLSMAVLAMLTSLALIKSILSMFDVSVFVRIISYMII
jgi:hypothetical protein